MTTVLLIVGGVVLALALLVGWGICALAGNIDQDREDGCGERRS